MKKPFSPEAESLITSLRRLPETGSPAKGAGAKPLDSILEACIEAYSIGRKTSEEALLENWSRIVGEPFARRCQPERIDGGALIIQVNNPTLRNEIRFMESRILTALGSIPECSAINRIILKSGM